MGWIKLGAVIMSLGMDTFAVSISLGITGTSRGRWRLAGTFAACEGIMPAIGFLLGLGAGRTVGDGARIVGGLLLIAVAAWMVYSARSKDDETTAPELVGWALLVAGLSVSMDELAVGFTLGMIGAPIVAAITLIAVQAFLVTLIGLRIGRVVAGWVPDLSEQVAAVILAGLGVLVLTGIIG